MKGLILKDLYMMRHYCKSYLLIAAVFFAVSLFGGNMFFAFYPCLLCGMIPMNLLSYDERSKFLQYCDTLPVTRAQVVSAKYLLGLFVQTAVLILTGTVMGIKMHIDGNFVFGEFAVLMLAMLIVSALASAIPIPFVFKYGVEKGRIAYYVMIGLVCALGVLFSEFFKTDLTTIASGAVFAFAAVIGVGVYFFSWYLSTVFYKKREL